MSVPNFSLDRVIYAFNDQEDFTIGNACERVQFFGGSGSGKTSGSGEALARAFLSAGFGRLVMCAKKDVLDDWMGDYPGVKNCCLQNLRSY